MTRCCAARLYRLHPTHRGDGLAPSLVRPQTVKGVSIHRACAFVMRFLLPILLVALFLAYAPRIGHAQTNNDTGGSLSGPSGSDIAGASLVFPDDHAGENETIVYPSTTINTPTAYGARWTQVYAGMSVQERIRYSSFTDGIASMGAGLGSPERWVGVDVTFTILDTYTRFAEDRAVSLKVHRRLPGNVSVALGWENVWHTDATDGGSSPYAVVSKATRLHEAGPWIPFGVVVSSLGVGGDRFQSEDRFRRGETGVGIFGSVAVRLVRPVHAIANWTGQDLSLGLSITPIPKLPIVITPALMDVTGRAGDGTRFSASAAIVYDFRRSRGDR